jgi:hypothetical protein
LVDGVATISGGGATKVMLLALIRAKVKFLWDSGGNRFFFKRHVFATLIYYGSKSGIGKARWTQLDL